jgi:hypothetical protein
VSGQAVSAIERLKGWFWEKTIRDGAGVSMTIHGNGDGFRQETTGGEVRSLQGTDRPVSQIVRVSTLMRDGLQRRQGRFDLICHSGMIISCP